MKRYIDKQIEGVEYVLRLCYGLDNLKIVDDRWQDINDFWDEEQVTRDLTNTIGNLYDDYGIQAGRVEYVAWDDPNYVYAYIYAGEEPVLCEDWRENIPELFDTVCNIDANDDYIDIKLADVDYIVVDE